MKFVSHYAALVALWVTCAAGVASGADFPQKWVFASADVTSDEGLQKVLDSMKRYGLAEPLKDGSWRFRTSAYRLLDILNMAGRSLRGAEDAAGPEDLPESNG